MAHYFPPAGMVNSFNYFLYSPSLSYIHRMFTGGLIWYFLLHQCMTSLHWPQELCGLNISQADDTMSIYQIMDPSVMLVLEIQDSGTTVGQLYIHLFDLVMVCLLADWEAIS